MTTITLGFDEYKQRNPCAGCPAPCCLIQMLRYKAPANYADVDHIRYMLQFPHTEIAIALEGDWYVVKWETCSQFESSTCTCRVHNTPAKPLICTQYNAYDCWYKKNFVTDHPAGIYRLNMARFDVWVKAIRFDADGRIVDAPAFDQAQALVAPVPIEPQLRTSPPESLASDIRLAGL